jgi:DNA repair protein RadA/Sms
MYACKECGSRYPTRLRYCSVCSEQNTIITVPIAGKTFFVDRDRRLVSAKELAARGKIGIGKISGFEFFGDLPDTWTLALHGAPGGGKSTLALRLAVAIDLKVVFFSVEEGQSESMAKKLRDWEVRSDKILISDARNIKEIRQDISEHQPEMIVLDSVTVLGETLKHGRAIWILQSTKSGGFRGSQEMLILWLRYSGEK